MQAAQQQRLLVELVEDKRKLREKQLEELYKP